MRLHIWRSGGWVSECSFPLLSCRLLCSTRLDRDLLLARIIDVHIRPSDAYFVHSLFMYRTTRQLPTTINKTRSHEMSLVEKTSIGANSFLFFFFWLLCVWSAICNLGERERKAPHPDRLHQRHGIHVLLILKEREYIQ